MTSDSLPLILGYSVVGVLMIYVAARLVSTAYFLSRQQYEDRKDHKHEPRT